MIVKVTISKNLRNTIYKKFKKDSAKVYSLISSLKENVHKGKYLGRVSNIIIKELKYKTYRLYFIIDEGKLMLFEKGELKELLIRFLEISKKNEQQQTIDKIKLILRKVHH